MYPVNNISGIQEQESKVEGSHAIILLFVKPSDDNADSIIKKFNYLHYRSKQHCSIYLVGYSQYFYEKYTDAQEVAGIDNTMWHYSDQCFIEVCDQLENRLKHWTYSGEPEMIILQNSSSLTGGKLLDFRFYNYIDINYGIQKGYIDSFPRFMERMINLIQKYASEINQFGFLLDGVHVIRGVDYATMSDLQIRDQLIYIGQRIPIYAFIREGEKKAADDLLNRIGCYGFGAYK